MTQNSMMTIGHSTHHIAAFLRLLRQNHVTAVADVRSIPASRFTPQFNRKALVPCLAEVGIKYVFMGGQLGARTEDTNCYIDGRVHYGLLAQTDEFNRGIERLLKGAQRERVAIMCAEREPLDCHRTVLVARVLIERGGVKVNHIHGDGQVERHATAMQRLMAKFRLDEVDLFHTPDELLEEALSRQEHRIAYFNEALRAEDTLQ
jgi:uncharacterized protein (DUF488 family)